MQWAWNRSNIPLFRSIRDRPVISLIRQIEKDGVDGPRLEGMPEKFAEA